MKLWNDGCASEIMSEFCTLLEMLILEIILFMKGGLISSTIVICTKFNAFLCVCVCVVNSDFVRVFNFWV